MLRGVHERFSEGLGTADHQDARLLLDELGVGVV
jgi:hypothetical protein